jgi:hypothetical protein
VRYTTLRVTDGGVVLLALHHARLAAEGAEAARTFLAFAAGAAPGVYSLRASGSRLDVEARQGSRLHDGMPTRRRVSPVAGQHGPSPKPCSPCAYDSVREPGVTTLLTSADGTELLEACVAAVVGWDGVRFVLPPADRPRVESVTVKALQAHLPQREAPLAVDSEAPLAVLNAVAGLVRVVVPGRAPFPEAPAAAVQQLLASLTRREL